MPLEMADPTKVQAHIVLLGGKPFGCIQSYVATGSGGRWQRRRTAGQGRSKGGDFPNAVGAKLRFNIVAQENKPLAIRRYHAPPFMLLEHSAQQPG